MERDESSQGLSISLRVLEGLVGFIFVLFLQEQTAISMEITLELQETLTEMSVVACSEKNRCLLKCQPNDLCGTDSEDSTAALQCLKSNNNEKWSLIAVELGSLPEWSFCLSVSCGEMVGIYVAQDSYLFSVFRSIGQTDYLEGTEIDTGCFIVLTFLFPQWIELKVIDLFSAE